MYEHAIFRRTAVVAATIAAATAAGAGVAAADTVNVPFTDSNVQASVMASEVTTCFSGTGPVVVGSPLPSAGDLGAGRTPSSFRSKVWKTRPSPGHTSG